jgi:23S rRNA pseudouridine1911/1915/1917 synthase
MVRVGRLKKDGAAAADGELAISVVRRLTGLSQNQARTLFAKGKVQVRAEPCTAWATPLRAGDLVSIDTDRKDPRKLPKLAPDAIVHLDSAIVVVNKPAGLVSVPPTRTGEPTLLDLLTRLLAGLEGSPEPLPLHRLDRGTSGLMVFGIAGAPMAALRKQFETHEVRRAYYAVVQGRMPAGTLAGEIDVSRVRFGGEKQTRFARTEVTVLETSDETSLLICRPGTGRFHQLRIQLAAAGHPILGETEHLPPPVVGRPDGGGGSGLPCEARRTKLGTSGLPSGALAKEGGGTRSSGPQSQTGAVAGARSLPAGRLALQSFFLEFLHPLSGRRVSFELPLDPALAGLIGENACGPKG